MIALTIRLVPLILVFITNSWVKCQTNSSIDNEIFNITVSLNETQDDIRNISDNNSTSTETPVATTLEPSITTAIAETSEEDAYRHYTHYSDDYCTCDLKLEWCDVECCCDPDCTDSERSAFGECIETRSKIYESRYCHNKNIVYINNTKTTVEKSFNGLFCIVWDNSNTRHLFEDIKPINDLNKILNITAQHDYNWTHKSSKKLVKLTETDVLKPGLKLKSGKDILITKVINETKIYSNWKLPNSVIMKEGECNSLTSIKYLKDFDSVCYRLFRNFPEQCLESEHFSANYYKSFQFISRNFMNQTDTNPITIDISSDVKYEEPVVDLVTRECNNVVKSVKYTVWHNGSNGIIDVNLSIKLTSLKPNTTWFKQSFSVTFLWYNKSEGIDLSGNPGYIVGKPILAAFMAKDKTNLTRNMNGYQIMTYSNKGFCDLNSNKESIKFRTNIRSGCLLRLNFENEDNLCESIQKTIWKLLEPEPLIDYIGIFGNASSQVITDWIRVLDIDNTSCDPLNDNLCPILITGISLHFYYVYAGSINQPQAKIVGVVKRYHSQSDVVVKCHKSTDYCDDFTIELSNSVSFYDITKPSRPDYAPPVTFKIQLPSDFFYPFLTSSQIKLPTTNKISIICLCILYLLL